jgi:DNA replication protein DnaC
MSTPKDPVSNPAPPPGTTPATTPPTVLLDHYLGQLKLPTIRREYKSLALQCAQERADYPAYLLRLAERELLDRERRAAERRIKAACFPVLKTMDTFDFTAQPGVNQTLLRQLAGGEFMDRKENVLLLGNSGTGKTHLATALGLAACALGRRVRFYSAASLVTALLERREERTLGRTLKAMERMELIVIDELGYIPFSKAGAELLFEVVSRAYERTSLIVTTNLPFEAWTEVLGGERLTGALLDRLTHRVHILEANGESYRLRDARGRLARQRPAKNGGE